MGGVASAVAAPLAVPAVARAEEVQRFRYLWELEDDRRAPSAPQSLLSAVRANVSASAPPLPGWASELDPFPEPGQPGNAPVIRWEPLGQKTDPLGGSLAYPAWLRGTWSVRYARQLPQFPAGFGVMATSLSAAGIEAGSILRLADINADAVQAQWRFAGDAATGEVRADWEYTLPRILTAFLRQAEIVGTSRAETLDGPGFALTYRTPGGLFGTSVEERTSTLTWLAAESWQDPERGTFLSAEWQRQRGKVSSVPLTYDYKILTLLRRVNGQRVVGLVRAASFVQPTEGSYQEAAGRPATVYTYAVELTPSDGV